MITDEVFDVIVGYLDAAERSLKCGRHKLDCAKNDQDERSAYLDFEDATLDIGEAMALIPETRQGKKE